MGKHLNADRCVHDDFHVGTEEVKLDRHVSISEQLQRRASSAAFPEPLGTSIVRHTM